MVDSTAPSVPVTASHLIDAIREANSFQVKGHILEKERFIDRSAELREAIVICRQVVKGGTGGIFIVGGKGVGKSSLLQAITREMNAQGIVSTRIAIDESWTAPKKESLFFRTIVAEITRAAADQKRLDQNIASKVVAALLSHLHIEEIRAEFPYMSIAASIGDEGEREEFPSIYFRDALRELLAKIRENGSLGLVICLDDGDYLVNNPILLQVLKNVFQDTPGAGIVLAGTDTLLQYLSSSFSPMMRFVQRLDLGPYDSQDSLLQAIRVPLSLTKQKLSEEQKLSVEFDPQSIGGSTFEATVERVSGRMPLDTNLLCHYAIEYGANKARDVGSVIHVPLRIDYSVAQGALRQLVGTKEYGSLIDTFDSQEVSLLKMLGQADYQVTIDELTLLLYLDEMGKNVQTTPIVDMCSRISGFRSNKAVVEGLIKSISEKASKRGVHAIRSGITYAGGLLIEDQWLRAYFKLSVPKIWYDLEVVPNVPYTGIRYFYDPVASVIHSVFFPRFGKSITGRAQYHAHQHAGRADFLHIEQGRKLLTCLYRRVADGRLCHLAFQLRSETDTAEWIMGINILLQTLRNENVINLFERAQERRQNTDGRPIRRFTSVR